MIQVIFTVETDEQASAIIEVVAEAEADALDFAFDTARVDLDTGARDEH